MYSLPSTSVTMHPWACLMNSGVPPTALNARTGDETPPGITCLAFKNAASEFDVDRVLRSDMGIGDLSDTDATAKDAKHARQSNNPISKALVLAALACLAVQLNFLEP